jgi:thiol-disulfide isomerase/thioredoxin
MKKPVILFSILLSLFYSFNLFSQPAVGQTAPSLSGIKIIDKQIPNLENKFVFIDFWATWCSPCRESLPHVDKLAEKYKDKVAFFAISDEKEKDVRQFLQKNNFNSLIFGLDIQNDLYSGFNIRSIPQYYLLSPTNTILASGNSSEVSDHYLDSIFTKYATIKNNNINQIKIIQDSLEKISSIEISEKVNARQFISKTGYSILIRDSLKNVLQILCGVQLEKRMRFG